MVCAWRVVCTWRVAHVTWCLRAACRARVWWEYVMVALCTCGVLGAWRAVCVACCVRVSVVCSWRDERCVFVCACCVRVAGCGVAGCGIGRKREEGEWGE